MGLLKNDSYNDLFIENIQNYFKKNNRYILGYFFDEELISYIGVIRWLNRPYWTFTTAKAKLFWRSKIIFQPEMNGMALLIRKVLGEESRLGYSAYWFLTSLKRNQGHRNYWSSFIPELKNYFLISRVIKKNYRPIDSNIWSLMGKQLWDEDLILRIGIEKNHVQDIKPFFNLLQIPSDKIELENEDTGLVLHC